MSRTISITTIKVEGKNALGLRAELPDSPPLLLITAERGFVMCGFLNIEAAEKLSLAAAVISGVKTFEDMLNGQVKTATTKAKSLGIEIGMKGNDVLKHLL